MNAHPRLLFAAISLSGAVFLTPASAAPATTSPYGFRVSTVQQSGIPIVERGTTAFTVRNRLGEPQRKLDGNNWVYYRFHPVPSQGARDNCCTLIITFADGQVSKMRLVNPAGASAIAASLTPRSETRGRLASK